jgi:hypothetical protein
MRRIPAVIVALALALVLAAAPSARASSRAVTGPMPGPPTSATTDFYAFSGPVPVGDDVVWATRSEDGAVSAWVNEASGRTQSVLDLPDAPDDSGAVSIAAVPGLVAVIRKSTHCFDDCRSSIMGPVTDDVWTGPVAGPLKRSFGCGAPGPVCTGDAYTCNAPQTALSADWITTGACTGSFTLTDLRTGTQRPFGETSPSLAGRYLATVAQATGIPRQDNPARLVVRDLETGTEAYRIDVPSPNPVDAYFFTSRVQADGTAVVQSGSGAWWASVAEPFLHPMQAPGAVVNIVGGRVAFVAGPRLGREVTVTDLTGTVLAKVPVAPTLGRVAFDGRRVAWASRPCQDAVVVVREVADADGPLPSTAPCPAPAISRKTRKADDAFAFSVKLSCPATPALGCAGTLHLVGRQQRGKAGRGTRELAVVPYALAGGATRVFAIRLTRGGITFLRAARRVDVTARTIAIKRADGAQGARARTSARFVLVAPRD